MADALLKNILNNMVENLEGIANDLGALEAALVQRGLLEPGEMENYLGGQRHKLVNIRYWISQLLD